MKKKLTCIFMGTPEFSVSSLEVLFKHDHIDLALVISQEDKPSGRGQALRSPPVAAFAKKKALNLIQTQNINKNESFHHFLLENKIDFIFVMAFSQFLGEKILKATRLGCFNVHTSLLPKYRGAAPIQYALLNGDKETGISIQRMVKKMDAGDIVYETTVSINPDETSFTLFSRLQILTAQHLPLFLEKLIQSALTYRSQNEEEATFAPIIKKEDGLIQFEKENITNLLNKLKAYASWPGLYAFSGKKRVKFLELAPCSENIPPGVVDLSRGEILIGVQDGSIRVRKIQFEGKKSCSDIDYLNGQKGKAFSLVFSTTPKASV